ncbi:hypothetical protein AQUCO_00900076v1 [Aquilegia coerulea]|uniref:SUZ domain-containing protein n=1 Tax=Aquilegia coerulea TaxID=218851 RepID=A0A2G5EBU9_AQUCA|nr:hypothetical protein AQUCO_00900076v1 [Aquilegia coerulea]
MDYSPSSSSSSLPAQEKEVVCLSSSSTTTPTLVDPFLKEALQNPRHRLTILRMELDVQSFMQNHDQQLFEFPHFPTSYLRLAAHRVAQHYGLQSMVVDNVVDGLRTKIVVKKTAESKHPPVCLSEVPAEQNDKTEQVKIAIKQRSQNAGLNGANEAGAKHSTLKTMEERKEEYDRARARIFKSSNSPDSEDASSQASLEERSFCLSRDVTEGCRNFINEPEKTLISRDGNTSRVAIFRDREKDRTDPDYDRSYDRYVRGLPPNQSFGLGPYNTQTFQPSFVQYEAGIPPHGMLPRTQVSLSYRPSNPIMSPFCSVGLNQTSGDSLYTHCPSLALMYTQSYEQVRHAVFQAPFYHQPLSFDYSQNY